MFKFSRYYQKVQHSVYNTSLKFVVLLPGLGSFLKFSVPFSFKYCSAPLSSSSPIVTLITNIAFFSHHASYISYPFFCIFKTLISLCFSLVYIHWFIFQIKSPCLGCAKCTIKPIYWVLHPRYVFLMPKLLLNYFL